MFGSGSALGSAIVIFLEIIQYAIIIRALVSWLPVPKDNQFIRILYQVTDPILVPIRSILERSSLGRNMMIDFSPIIAFLLIRLLISVIGSAFNASASFGF